jgi:hypothetical protein
MMVMTWSNCECDRCEQGKEGGWIGNQWTCLITGQYYKLVSE